MGLLIASFIIGEGFAGLTGIYRPKRQFGYGLGTDFAHNIYGCIIVMRSSPPASKENFLDYLKAKIKAGCKLCTKWRGVLERAPFIVSKYNEIITCIVGL